MTSLMTLAGYLPYLLVYSPNKINIKALIPFYGFEYHSMYSLENMNVISSSLALAVANLLQHM